MLRAGAVAGHGPRVLAGRPTSLADLRLGTAPLHPSGFAHPEGAPSKYCAPLSVSLSADWEVTPPKRPCCTAEPPLAGNGCSGGHGLLGFSAKIRYIACPTFVSRDWQLSRLAGVGRYSGGSSWGINPSPGLPA